MEHLPTRVEKECAGFLGCGRYILRDRQACFTSVRIVVIHRNLVVATCQVGVL